MRVNVAYKGLRIDRHMWRCAIVLHIVLVETSAILDGFDSFAYAIRFDSATSDTCLRDEEDTG